MALLHFRLEARHQRTRRRHTGRPFDKILTFIQTLNFKIEWKWTNSKIRNLPIQKKTSFQMIKVKKNINLKENDGVNLCELLVQFNGNISIYSSF